MSARAGTVALFGWTNVGKSTLLNRLVGAPLAAVADVAQTTRRRILGVVERPGGQIAFVDTPGLHEPRTRMNRAMVELALESCRGVDLTLLVLDAERGFGDGDRRAAQVLSRSGAPRLAVLNKLDRVQPRSRLLPLMHTAVETWGCLEAIPVSARSGEGLELLLERVLECLPAGAPPFPPDFLTDQSERVLASERIREKLLIELRQELPHASAVLIERFHERADGRAEIDAVVLVDRESQRPIVIGRGGELLKRVGTAARLELEQLLGRAVVLHVWVRVRPEWRDDPRVLRELDLS